MVSNEGAINASALWYSPGLGININNNQALVHEFGHNLGLAHIENLICYDSQNQRTTFSNNCQSSGGSFTDVMGAAGRDAHFNSYNKETIGWLASENIINTTSGVYKLNPLETISSGIQIIKIPIRNTQYQYFLEYRKPIGFDAYDPWNVPLNGVYLYINKLNTPFTYLLDLPPFPDQSAFEYGPINQGQPYIDNINGISISVQSLSQGDATLSINSPILVPSPAPPPTPPPTGSTGLVAWWRMDESSGTSASDAFGINTGTLSGGATFVAGKINNAVNLDGANDYVRKSAPIGIPSVNAAKSISLWVTTRDTSTTRQALVLDAAGANAEQIELRGTKFVYSKSGGAALVNSNITPALNTWYHIVATWDGTTNRIYINGVERANSTTAHNSGAVETLSIGTYESNFEFWNGLIDDVRIYNRALTASEVLSIFNSVSGLVEI
jgi:hypothetical protein